MSTMRNYDYEEQVADLVGDIAVTLVKLFAKDSKGYLYQDEIKDEWKQLAKRFMALIK